MVAPVVTVTAPVSAADGTVAVGRAGFETSIALVVSAIALVRQLSCPMLSA